MKTVILAGELGKRFGRSWRLDVSSPAEALRAIEANRPGFFAHLAASGDRGVGYRVLLGHRTPAQPADPSAVRGRTLQVRDIDPAELRGPFAGERLILAPVVCGASSDSTNWGKVIVGAILVAAAIYFGDYIDALGLSAGTVGMFGVSLMASGVSGLLAKSAETMDANPVERKPSYLFNGPVNTIAQGGCVPVGYGRLTVGSQVISGGIRVDEYVVTAPVMEENVQP